MTGLTSEECELCSGYGYHHDGTVCFVCRGAGRLAVHRYSNRVGIGLDDPHDRLRNRVRELEESVKELNATIAQLTGKAGS